MKLLINLQPHQEAAYEKMRKLKVGALYMEMGTGKTGVVLNLIKSRFETGKIDTVLWLCPCSVKTDIAVNIATSSAGIREIIHIYGIESLSQSDKLYLKLLDLVQGHKVFLVVDESTLVKNHFAKRTARIETLAGMCAYKIILNGTPVSRDEADLFAQWYILDKRILGYNSFWSFAANHIETDEYGKPQRCLNVDYLSRKIEPYTFSCSKKDCLKLPKKRYYNAFFDLTNDQEQHYEEIKDVLLNQVNEFDSTTIYRLFTALQLICSGREVIKTNPLKSRPFFDHPMDNPRIKKLLDILPDKEDETKIIIWCKFQHEIDDIKKILGDVAEFHGKIPLGKRIKELERFRNSKTNILLANKVCGGYGLNLQFCHEMIYYSNDFNWATRAQSEDRVHRIGQTHQVDITDLYANSKVDMRIGSCLNRKERLADRFKQKIKESKNLSKWIDGLEG